MPKVSTETTEAPKRAPRKRAVRRVVAKSDTPVRRTRSAASVDRETPAVATPRKAPARVLTTEPKAKTNKTKLYVVLASVVLVGGAAMWIGVSDAGQIDVTARINEVNEKAAAAPQADNQNNESQSIVVPVQDTPPVVPITSLRGRGVGTPDVTQPVTEPAPEVATSTEATTTDETVAPEASPAEEETTETSVE